MKFLRRFTDVALPLRIVQRLVVGLSYGIIKIDFSGAFSISGWLGSCIAVITGLVTKGPLI